MTQMNLQNHEPPLRIIDLHDLGCCNRLFYRTEVEGIQGPTELVYAGRELHTSLEADDDYDVRDPWRLRRAGKVCEGAGHRMQYSVFRCWMNVTDMQRLRWELTKVLETEDDVLIIPLCSRCVEGMETTHSANNEPNWPKAPESYRLV
jgi:CRISPR-associated protein Cas2